MRDLFRWRWLAALSLGAASVLGACGGDSDDDGMLDDPGGSLARRGFPATCPDPSEVFEEMNAASYQVFGETALVGAGGTTQLQHTFIGTAWAVRPRLLVTNAHVTEAFQASAKQGTQFTRAIAVQAGTGTVIRLLRGLTHPDYNEDPLRSPDVGLFTSQEALPARLTLAADDTVLALGDSVQISGFPGDVEDFITVIPGMTVPQATSLSGNVTARRSHDDTQMVTADTLDVYQHQAPTTPGTSGSAMVHCGLVVGVNNAGTVQLIVTPDPQQPGQFTINRQAAANNNFGVHVRHIHELLELFDASSLQGYELPVMAVQAPGGGMMAPIGGGDPNTNMPDEVLAVFAGGIPAGDAAHEFAFAIMADGSIIGTSLWPQAGEFGLLGELSNDGSFVLVDDTPERIPGFRRGLYSGSITTNGSMSGIYFEEGDPEQRTFPFSGFQVQ